MRRRRNGNVIVTLTVVILLLANTPIGAHHSFAAEYDRNAQITIKGPVVKMEWINPHAWVTIRAKGPDGKESLWMAEMGGPNTLLRRGFGRDSLPVGTIIQIVGYRAKDRGNRINGRDLTYSDGRTVFMGSSGTGAPYDDVPNKK